MTSRDFDILIVGGGPSGLSTWLHIARNDPDLAARTLLVEKAAYPRHKVCGGGMVPLCDQILRDLGVELRIPSVSIRNIEYKAGSRTLTWHGANLFRVVRRIDFDHALAKAAMERGLHLQQGEAFLGFERQADFLIVSTSKSRYRVRTLVGADGTRSVVRTALNLTEPPRIARLFDVVTRAEHYEKGLVRSETAVFDFTPVAEGLQGYVWDFPTPAADSQGFNRGIYDSRIRPELPSVKLKDVFCEALRDRGCAQEPSLWSGCQERWFSPEGIYGVPNVLLVGDAAGVEPVFGEGISHALRYGAIAAECLVRSFRKRDFECGDYQDYLLRSPLGVSLSFQTSLAKQLYTGGHEALERLHQLIARQIAFAGG